MSCAAGDIHIRLGLIVQVCFGNSTDQCNTGISKPGTDRHGQTPRPFLFIKNMVLFLLVKFLLELVHAVPWGIFVDHLVHAWTTPFIRWNHPPAVYAFSLGGLVYGCGSLSYSSCQHMLSSSSSYKVTGSCESGSRSELRKFFSLLVWAPRASYLPNALSMSRKG